MSRKLEADSARLRLLEDAINERLAHIRGKLEGLRTAEALLIAAADNSSPSTTKENG
jgi:hypothetical protein